MVRQTVNDILAGFGFSPDELADDARLRRDLELDSTETVEVALELRRRLGVSVKLDADRDQTVGELCALVQDTLAGTATPG